MDAEGRVDNWFSLAVVTVWSAAHSSAVRRRYIRCGMHWSERMRKCSRLEPVLAGRAAHRADVHGVPVGGTGQMTPRPARSSRRSASIPRRSR